MQNRDDQINALLRSLEDLAISDERQKIHDREVIIKNFLQLFETVPTFIEEGKYSYGSISLIIKTYLFTKYALHKIGYSDEKLYLNDSKWIRVRTSAEKALSIMRNPNKEDEYIRNQLANSEAETPEYLYREFLLNLQMLALPYAEQKPFYPPIADILEEVVWEFDFSFEALPQLIERDYFNYDAIAWTIRTYLELEKCVNSVGYDDEDIYENSPEWKEVRRVANHTLTFMQPLKYNLKDVTSR